MQTEFKVPTPSGSALWSLLWRAVLLTPFAVAFSVVWLLVWSVLLSLPVLEISYLLNHEWLSAIAALMIWGLAFWLRRLPWFHCDRHNFPNDQENI